MLAIEQMVVDENRRIRAEGRRTGMLEGKRIGILEGESKRTKEIIKNMFKKKVDIEDIKAFTGATKEEIEEIRKSMKK